MARHWDARWIPVWRPRSSAPQLSNSPLDGVTNLPTGTVVSRLDLTNIVPRNAIEGVTIDEHGTIYLLAEHAQFSGAPADSQSQLIVLTAVPEPETYAMLLAGLGLIGSVVRRKRSMSSR